MREEISWGRIIIAAMALGAALTTYLVTPNDATLPILAGVISGLMLYFAGLYTQQPGTGQLITASIETIKPTVSDKAPEPPVAPIPPAG